MAVDLSLATEEELNAELKSRRDALTLTKRVAVRNQTEAVIATLPKCKALGIVAVTDPNDEMWVTLKFPTDSEDPMTSSFCQAHVATIEAANDMTGVHADDGHVRCRKDQAIVHLERVERMLPDLG